ncbi:MAG: hypothetical protein Q8L14_08575 [Myxococcales bacterium]|nr:hypothetical protein [Myxococcales bacterium]
MRIRLVVLAVAVFASFGCSAAFLAAKRGQDALDRGDVEAAMAEYWSACRQSDDKDWCERADRLYLDLKATLLIEATPVCGQRGQERKCFDIVNRARRIKDDPQLAALADASGRTWLEGCRASQVNTPIDAVVRVRCLVTMKADVNTPAYEQQLTQERQQLAQFVGAQAKVASDSGLKANAVGLGSLARCFSKEVELPVPLDALNRELQSRLPVSASLASDGLVSAPGACADLQRLSKGRLLCVATGAEVGVRVGLSRSDMSHEWNDTLHDVTYVARREQYDNPEWYRLEGRRVECERNARAARKNAKLAADDCSLAQSDLSRAQYCQNCEARRNEEAYCRRKSTMEDLRRDAERELDDVESHQRRTDRQLIREITDVYRYTRRTHTWRQNFRVIIAAAGPRLGSRDFTVTLTRTGVDQPDFQPAGVDGSTARVPSQDSLDADGFAELEEALGAWVNESLGTLAQAREATCSPEQGRPQQLECKVGAAFLRGEEPGRFYVAELGRDADRVAKYPAAPCSP